MFTYKWRRDFFRQFKKAKRPYAILFKYSLLQIPELVLVIAILLLLKQWFDLPAYVVWGVTLLWAVKDVLLFPLTWRSYDSSGQFDAHPMVGREGVAQEPLAPLGYIRVGGELWLAEAIGGQGPIKKGEKVRVRKIKGLKLFVDREVKEPNR